MEKDPSDVVKFTVDWSAWLTPGDKIIAAEVTARNSLTINPQAGQETTNTDTAVQFWAGGGAPNTDYKVSCTVTTQMGYTVQRSFPVWVMDM